MSEDDEVDARLVFAMAQGDRAALGLLHQRHGRALLGLAERLLGGPERAGDVVHEVLLEAWGHARDYRPERGSVRVWLMVRLRSRALDQRRRDGRARAVAQDPRAPAPGPWPDPSSAPDHIRVRARLAALAPAHREVLDLAYFSDLSAREIAARLDLPVGTVKSRTAAALAALRAAMCPEEAAR